MTAYISVSFSKRQELNKEIEAIRQALYSKGFSPFIFVDSYCFQPHQEREMMQQALKELDTCRILIAETSDKAIGIGIEAGYAKAKGKPVIYLRNKNSEHSTTVSGISDFQIIYEKAEELKEKLSKIVEQIRQDILAGN